MIPGKRTASGVSHRGSPSWKFQFVSESLDQAAILPTRRMARLMSKLELQTPRRRSSRREKSALKICLVEKIIRPHEKADRPVFLYRNPIAGSHVHFVNSVEAIGLRRHVAVDRRQIAAGCERVEG